MSDLFFYGSLRHLPLLEIVLGRDRDAIEITSCVLPGHIASWVQDEPFPMIAAADGHRAPGLLVRGLSDTDIARLRYYEGGFDFDLSPVTVHLPDGSGAVAAVFFPEPGLWVAGSEWSLEDWVQRWGDLSVRAATEAMAHFGHLSASELADRLPMMRLRAAARLTALARPADPLRDMARDVVVRSLQRPYVRFFAVDEMDLQYRRHDGGMSPVVNRAALLVGQAAVVLPYDPVRDTVLLVEQFRAPVFVAGDPAPWVWEPVAGLVDPGETPQQAAHREAMEEAGVTLTGLEPAGQVYSSTGSSTEFLNLFIGLADLSQSFSGGGLASEGEDIRSKIVPFETLMTGVDRNEFVDMPLVTCALWLARHRHRLRAGT